METFEATELIPVGDQRHRRLVSIQEVLDELQRVKKRLATLEYWRDVNFEASPGKSHRRIPAGPAADSPQLEAGSETDDGETTASDRVGDGEYVAGVLADVAPEDSFSVRSPHADVELVHEIAAAGSDDDVHELSFS
jgi:hypothetical protein